MHTRSLRTTTLPLLLAAALPACGAEPLSQEGAGGAPDEEIGVASEAITTTTWFDSNANWPPTVRNNPYAQRSFQPGRPAGFFINFWGECMDGALANTSPQMSFLSVPPYDGAYSGAHPANGSYELSCPGSLNNLWPNSHVSLDTGARTFGNWLGTKPFRCTNCIHNGLVNFEPHYTFPYKSDYPFGNGGRDYLEVSWHARIQPTTGTDSVGYKVPHDVMYLTFRNGADRLFAYGIPVWDIRGKTYDTCRPWFNTDVTAIDFANSCMDGTYYDGTLQRYHEPVTGSLRSSAVWDATYTIRMRREHIRRLLRDYNAWAAAQGKPQWATDDASLAAIAIDEVSFNHEIGNASNWTVNNGTLGIAKWNWNVVKGTDTVERAQCVVYSGANGTGSVISNGVVDAQTCRINCNAPGALWAGSRSCYFGTKQIVPVFGASFESSTDTSGWTMSHNCAANTGWFINRYYTATDNPAPQGGSYALRLHTTGFTGGACLYPGAYATSPVMSAVAGKRYYMNNWSRNAANNAVMRIMFNDASMKEIGSFSRSCNTDSWQYNRDGELVVTAPAGTQYMQFRYELLTPNEYADMDLLGLTRDP